MKLKEAMLLWNDNSSDVKIVRWGVDYPQYEYLMKSGMAAFTRYRHAEESDQLIWMLIDAFMLVVRDGVDAKAVHEELKKVDEYNELITGLI